MSLLKLDKKEDPVELIQKAIEYVDNLCNSYLLNYLEKFEPENYQLLKEVSHIKMDEKLKDNLHIWMKNWQTITRRLNLPAPNKTKAEIHILSNNLKLEDSEYRKILYKATGVKSSKYMSYYEINLVVFALKELTKERN